MLGKICVLFLTIFALAGCSKAPDTNRLRIGMELSYPPFEMTAKDGSPAGVSPDLARELSTWLKRELVIENLPFDGLIPSLKTGKIDLIISSLTATPERAKSIDFSEPYLSTGLCLLVGANSDIQAIDGVNREGRTVVVKQGTTGQLYAAGKLPKPRVLVLDQENACVLEVAQGKADAFIYDQMSVFSNWRKNPTTTRALLQPFQAESWAIGLRKGNDELRTQVNAFLKDFRGRRGFEQLGEKWLRNQKDAFRERGIPFFF